MVEAQTVCQLYQVLSLSAHCCLFAELCVYTPLTNPVIISHVLCCFFMCQKGNGLCLVECGLFDVRKLQRQMALNQELAHPPVHIYQNIVQLAIYSVSLCLFVPYSFSIILVRYLSHQRKRSPFSAKVWRKRRSP